MNAAVKLLLVDDHALMRDGLHRILAAHSPAWQIQEAESAAQALELLRQQPVDLLITDLSMPGMNGLELIKRAKLRAPNLKVLVLSMHEEQQYALRAFKSGASGYLTKDCVAEDLVEAVNKVAAGGVFISGGLAAQVVHHLSGTAPAPSHALLTDRELDVLRRLVAGQRLTDIADSLHLSIKTISTHKSRIQEKLQLPNLSALVRYGLEHQLLSDGLAPETTWPQMPPPERAGSTSAANTNESASSHVAPHANQGGGPNVEPSGGL